CFNCSPAFCGVDLPSTNRFVFSRAVISASCSCNFCAEFRMSFVFDCHAVVICCNTWRKLARPYLVSGGQYVPPKNGLRSGVRKTFSGQPPDPVIACTNVM